MVASTRKWILLTVGINLALAILFGQGFVDIGIWGLKAPSGMDTNALGTGNNSEEFAMQDGLYGQDTTQQNTYMIVGINPLWSLGKILGLLLLGTPIVLWTVINIAIAEGTNSIIGILALFLSLGFTIINVYMALALYQLIFKQGNT